MIPSTELRCRPGKTRARPIYTWISMLGALDAGEFRGEQWGDVLKTLTARGDCARSLQGPDGRDSKKVLGQNDLQSGRGLNYPSYRSSILDDPFQLYPGERALVATTQAEVPASSQGVVSAPLCHHKPTTIESPLNQH